MTFDYIIKSGDTLSKIALDNNISVAELKKLNNMTSDKLKQGQKIVIPGAQTYLDKAMNLKPAEFTFGTYPEDTPEYYELPENIERQIYIESKNRPTAISGAGAKGLMLVMPATHTDYVKATKDTGDLFDPEYNKKVGMWKLDQISGMDFVNKTDQSGGISDLSRMAKIYGAYNHGPGNMIANLNALKKKGYDIYNNHSWIYAYPIKETREYMIKNLGFDQALNDSLEASKKKSGGMLSYLNYTR